MTVFRFRRHRNQLKKYCLSSPDITKTLLKAGVYLSIALFVHVLAMVTFEKLSFSDSIWLTFTTITTVGYGDLSAATLEGRLSTILILFLGGIFILAETAGHVFNYFSEKQAKKMKGQWRWNMTGHILIMNTPANNGEEYFERLITQFRQTDEFKNHPVQILTRHFSDGLPGNLQNMEGVVHYNGRPDDVETLAASNAKDASVIIVLCKDDSKKSSDGRTFDILHRLNDMGVEATILAECVDDNNRERLRKAGANLVIRPIRAYPEMIVRSFVAPGSEQIIENMFTQQGDEYKRYDINIKANKWSDIVCKLSLENIGTAIGYIDKASGKLVCNPHSDEQVISNALFVMVREGMIPDSDTVNQLLTN